MSPGWILLVGYGSAFAILAVLAVIQYVLGNREAERRAEQRKRAYDLLDRLRASDEEVTR